MRTLKQPTLQEFTKFRGRLIHVPTGARFSHSHLNCGNAGCVLPNGDDYDRDAIYRMAKALLLEVSAGEGPAASG